MPFYRKASLLIFNACLRDVYTSLLYMALYKHRFMKKKDMLKTYNCRDLQVGAWSAWAPIISRLEVYQRLASPYSDSESK